MESNWKFTLNEKYEIKYPEAPSYLKGNHYHSHVMIKCIYNVPDFIYAIWVITTGWNKFNAKPIFKMLASFLEVKLNMKSFQNLFYWKIFDIRPELPFNKIHSSILVCVDNILNSQRD